jgi:type IV pilus assembly PilX-like protein
MRDKTAIDRANERGVALVTALLLLALMLALTLGISMTAISELGVTNTYANQTQAFQAAEAGLYHGLNLVKNFTNEAAGGDPTFTKLLALRGTIDPSPYAGNNPFTDPTLFTSGSVMITDDDGNGHQLRDVTGNPVPGAYYKVHVIDDEKSSSTFVGPKVPNFNVTTTWEDNNPATDTNNRLVVYSIGTYGNTSVTLEGWVGFVPYPALVAQRDISVGGNSIIQGEYGGVHSNGNLDIGASAYVQQTATASGSYTSGGSAEVDGFSGGGQPPLYIPKFVTNSPLSSGGPKTTPRIQDYILRKADTMLIDPDYAAIDRTGETAHQRVNKLEARLNVTTDSMWNALTTAPADPHHEQAIRITRVGGVGTASLVSNVSDTGWTYNGGNGWDVQAAAIDNHTFYIVGMDNYNLSNPSASSPNGGNARITSNLGSDGTPIHVSVFATGSIEITGTPNFVSNATGVTTNELPPFVTVNLMFVTVEDVKIRGDAGVPRFSGIIYAGEQFDLSGNGAFDGQVISLSNNDVSGSLVSANSVSGSFELTFNGGQAVGNIRLMSWRQIKR